MRRLVALVVSVSVFVVAPARAHDGHEFEPVAEAARWRPAAGDRVLFFPLDKGFSGCLPLSAPCPADSSSLLLVKAAGRTVGWLPEMADLPASSLSVESLRAMGTAPSPVDGFRYLVPVLDGEGTGIEFLRRRFEGGKLVSSADETAAQHVVPVLVGPALGGEAPSGELPERIVEEPRLVDASELEDVAPALLVRRASPSRVVYGVRVEDEYVPLLDEPAVALAARHEGRVGLAVPAGEGGGSRVVTAADDEDGDDDDSDWVTLLRFIGFVALLAYLAVKWRRWRRLPG